MRQCRRRRRRRPWPGRRARRPRRGGPRWRRHRIRGRRRPWPREPAGAGGRPTTPVVSRPSDDCERQVMHGESVLWKVEDGVRPRLDRDVRADAHHPLSGPEHWAASPTCPTVRDASSSTGCATAGVDAERGRGHVGRVERVGRQCHPGDPGRRPAGHASRRRSRGNCSRWSSQRGLGRRRRHLTDNDWDLDRSAAHRRAWAAVGVGLRRRGRRSRSTGRRLVRPVQVFDRLTASERRGGCRRRGIRPRR